MSPWQCAEETAEYLKSKTEYEKVYAGMLPRIEQVKEKEKRSAAIAVRVVEVTDNEKSHYRLAIYCQTYDEDKERGIESLYHCLEAVRFELLSADPIKDRWRIELEEEMITEIPDEQPYPYWIGAIEYSVEAPRITNSKYINKMTW